MAVDLFLTKSSGVKNWGSMGLCQGTPVVLSHPAKVGSNRTEMEFPAVQLGSYRQAPLNIGTVFVHGVK